MTIRNIIRAAIIALIGIAGIGAVEAEPLPAPKQRPILTVSGNISATNEGDTAIFDRAMLEALGTISFETETPWYSEPVTFEGVPLAKLMQYVGAKGEHIVVKVRHRSPPGGPSVGPVTCGCGSSLSPAAGLVEQRSGRE